MLAGGERTDQNLRGDNVLLETAALLVRKWLSEGGTRSTQSSSKMWRLSERAWDSRSCTELTSSIPIKLMRRLGTDLIVRQFDAFDRRGHMPFRAYPEFIRPKHLQASLIRFPPNFKKPVRLLRVTATALNWAQMPEVSDDKRGECSNCNRQ